MAVLDEPVAFEVLVDVDVAVGVHPDGVSALAVAHLDGAAPAGEYVAVHVEDGHEAVQFRHEDGFIGVYVDVAGAGEAEPLLQEVAAVVENLDAVVLAVSDEDPPSV